jgi:hypothetical protein
MGRSLLVALLTLAWLPAARAELRPDERARLGPAAGAVEAAVARAGQAQLPAELLVDKAREGLAKGVPPARIGAVVAELEQALGRARAEAQPFLGAGAPPPRALLKSLVEAHAAGVRADDAAMVLRAGGRERALQVLTDLVQRGYPSGPAARTVAGVAGRPVALERLVGQAERLRASEGAARADVLDALGRANAQGQGIDHAEQLLHREERAADEGNGNGNGNNGRGPDRETSGARGPRSGGVAPPGHANNPK